MARLTTLELGVDRETLLDVMNRDGGAILRAAIAPETVKQMYDEVMPYVEVTPIGRDDFSGRETQRTGALVARTPTCRDLVLHDQVFEAAKEFLAPYAERVLLHLTQIIRIHPGQGAQMLHRDRLAWGTHLPRSIEPQFNTLWALTDFTAENGATRLVPGSQTWDWERRAKADEICHAEMSAGSVLLYTGSIIHGGGKNQSGLPRMGLNISYTLGWLRQEENQYLSCPPRIARDLAPELQELLGYTQGNYALATSPSRTGLPERRTSYPQRWPSAASRGRGASSLPPISPTRPPFIQMTRSGPEMMSPRAAPRLPRRARSAGRRIPLTPAPVAWGARRRRGGNARCSPAAPRRRCCPR